VQVLIADPFGYASYDADVAASLMKHLDDLRKLEKQPVVQLL
jgi:hypothetical protein